MKTTAQIRQAYLDFFHSKGHQVVESSSLVPDNDPTLLFTNAGMNQFKNVFLGLEKRPYTRATTAQRCVRAGGKHNDLENVGYTARHHTFFEMLGNFSFGDYFKHDAIHYGWEFLTSPQWLGLPKEKLWVTVYETDDEAYNIWHREIGIPAERIIRIGDNKGAPYASDNFWQMGDTGPCGPCTEIFYDHGDHIWGGPPGSPEEDGDRYIEIWNIVFMQFNRHADGTMEKLPKPSVDTGMGLERISAVLQHVNSNYDIDIFKTLIAKVAELTGEKDLANKSLRVIADHIRSCAYLIADGVVPSNEGRGYVLRRIIRRAVRHGHLLGATEAFFYKLVPTLIDVMAEAGKEVKKHQATVEKFLRLEEEQFARTLERGLTLLDEALANVKENVLSGEVAFKLYDTYGFPLDLTADVCRERGIAIDEEGFEREMELQRVRAQSASQFGMDYNSVIRVDGTTRFEGYAESETLAKVTALFHEGNPVESISAGQSAVVILDNTPFYAESGGQIGDIGRLEGNGFCFDVKDTQKYGQVFGHIGELIQGSLSIGQSVNAVVDDVRRQRISLNHSATHLLHAALRQVLGAMALFGEKYSEQVRVLTMGDFSIELCGGIHAKRTGDIGLFKIITETAVAAGIRRIEAITGETAIEWLQHQQTLLNQSAELLKSDVNSIVDKISLLQDKCKKVEKELQTLKEKAALQAGNELAQSAVEINGVSVIVQQLDGIEAKSLRAMVDSLKNQLGSAVVVFASALDEKVNLIVGVTQDLTAKVKAGELVNLMAQQVGGKGGGRPDMAMAGGTEPQNINKALSVCSDWLKANL